MIKTFILVFVLALLVNADSDQNLEQILASG